MTAQRPVRLAPSCFCVLAVLIQRPSYGYEVGQRYERAFGHIVATTLRNTYCAIDRLVEVGYAEVERTTTTGRQVRIYYRPTPDGIRAYWRWLEQQADLLRVLREIKPAGASRLDLLAPLDAEAAAA